MKSYSIREWPEEERPRERLSRFGAGTLSTAQLMAIILGTGGKEKSAIALARELLMGFNGLKEMEDATAVELSRIKGMGNAKVAQLKAALELGRRFMQGEVGISGTNLSFRNSRDVYEYYRSRFYGLKKERFLCALLDAKNRMFQESVISEGTLTSSPVHPREVFRYAIKEAAASVLFVHNHPSGDPDPSRDDVNITNRLVETGRVVGISVLDHIVLADGKFISMMEKGYIKIPQP